MSDVVSPARQVADALPGTLAEIVERTGYPVGAVLYHIGRLRATGTRVNAEMGERTIGDLGVEWGETVYAIDSHEMMSS